MASKNIFLREVVSQAPRIISLMDRNIFSPTYGCFDRQYWQYKTVDFAGARYQEGALTLALLWRIKSNENPYYKSEIINEWIGASVDFWSKIQEKNGSFNEWYPHEGSFVATAFSCCAISEVLLLMPKISCRDHAIKSLKKAGDWILNRNETRVFNQQAGAALFLHNLFLLTNEQKYKKSAESKIDIITSGQESEGWWMEYEGPDIGYLSLMIDYLARYYKKTQGKKVLAAIKRAVHFLKHFINPDGTVAGNCGSRNTFYLIPSGFYVIQKECSEALAVCRKISESLSTGKSVSPKNFDDRYLAYISYNWLFAYLSFKPAENGMLPCEMEKISLHFQKAGIIVFGNSNFYAIINARKGGVLSVFCKKTKKVFLESGVIQKSSSGFFSSGRISNLNRIIKNDIDSVLIEAYFFPVSMISSSTSKYVLLRVFQSTLGRSNRAGAMLKKALRDSLISKSNSNQKTNLKLRRDISVKNDSFCIKDEIMLEPSATEVYFGQKHSEIYVPSSQYFEKNELGLHQFSLKIGDKRKKAFAERKISADGKFELKKQ